jgi:hypothetical protein
MPGVGDFVALARLQADALRALPGTIMALNRSVRSLEALLADARDTLAVIARMAQRADAVVEELEEPLRLLAPGLQRAAAVLGDPVIATVPEVLRQVQRDVLPLLTTVVDTQAAVAGIAASSDRLMGLMDEVGGRLAGLTGLTSIGRFGRRPEQS